MALLYALAAGGSLLPFVLSAASGTPELVITDEGFRCRNALQSRSYQWAAITGAYRLPPEELAEPAASE
jgi:hypothetical protein